MTSIIFMFLAHSVSIWNPTENFIWILAWQTWQCHTISAPHTPAHSIFFLSLGLNICLVDVCDDLFGLWGGLGLFVVVCGCLWCGLWCGLCCFVVVCGILWWFVVFSATLLSRYLSFSLLNSSQVKIKYKFSKLFRSKPFSKDGNHAESKQFLWPFNYIQNNYKTFIH